MIPQSCPIPPNINPLQNNGYLLNITKLPEITFFCQEVNLPSISFPEATQPTPLVNIPIPGDKLNFGDLNVTFMIDEDMSNYIALYNWMVGLGFPEDHKQFASFINSETDRLNPNVATASYSDANLYILDSSSNPSKTVHFIDAVPVAVQQIQMESTTTDTRYIVAQATFKYSYFNFL